MAESPKKNLKPRLTRSHPGLRPVGVRKLTRKRTLFNLEEFVQPQPAEASALITPTEPDSSLPPEPHWSITPSTSLSGQAGTVWYMDQQYAVAATQGTHSSDELDEWAEFERALVHASSSAPSVEIIEPPASVHPLAPYLMPKNELPHLPTNQNELAILSPSDTEVCRWIKKGDRRPFNSKIVAGLYELNDTLNVILCESLKTLNATKLSNLCNKNKDITTRLQNKLGQTHAIKLTLGLGTTLANTSGIDLQRCKQHLGRRLLEYLAQKHFGNPKATARVKQSHITQTCNASFPNFYFYHNDVITEIITAQDAITTWQQHGLNFFATASTTTQTNTNALNTLTNLGERLLKFTRDIRNVLHPQTKKTWNYFTIQAPLNTLITAHTHFLQRLTGYQTELTQLKQTLQTDPELQTKAADLETTLTALTSLLTHYKTHYETTKANKKPPRMPIKVKNLIKARLYNRDHR